MNDKNSSDESLKGQAVSWVAGQPFNNVLLLLILAAMSWIGWYGVTTAIPAHLTQIQKGYESLSESHREERKELRDTYDRWMLRRNEDAIIDSKVAGKPNPVGD